MARCLIVQHLEPEGPYRIAHALEEAGVTVELRRTYLGEPLPLDVADVDGLVVMGGPMSASSDEGFPTRRAEIELLAEALDRHVPTLGVCLGAQLLAIAGGGAVHVGASGPEVGWGPIDLTAAAVDDPLLGGLPERLSVLHWHSDTFDPSPDAVHLASNASYRSQAFRWGSQAWGLQFHLEVDQAAITAFLDVLGAEAAAAGADLESIASMSATALAELAPLRSLVLSRFAELIASWDRRPLPELR